MSLFQELKVDFEYRTFGVIPTYKVKGGYVILESLQDRIGNISTNTELVDVVADKDHYTALLKKDGEIEKIKADKIVFATGGFGGKFRYTDCFRYKNYSPFGIILKLGGRTKNLQSVFVHPFGYNLGRLILTGKESSQGEFLTDEGNPAFSEEIRKMIKANAYHEQMPLLVLSIEEMIRAGRKVIFHNGQKTMEIVPTVHYTGGGIETNPYGKVLGCEDIYAIGECRSDGANHGGRLPGYAFTSAIVHAKFLAKEFSK